MNKETTPTPKKSNPITKNIVIALVLFVGLSFFLSRINFKDDNTKVVGISTLVEQIRAEQITSIDVENDIITATLKDKSIEKINKEPIQSFSELMSNYNVPGEKLQKISVNIKRPTALASFLSGLLPFLGPIILLIILFYFFFRQVQGANSRAISFGQSSARELAKDSKDKTTFADVAGVKEAKIELEEVVDFLKNPKKFSSLGAKIPKGVLLMGGPGTGKTLLARAVAGEANVPFFHISGSEFVEMFVGVGASRVRDLFTKAKAQAPCIIFIDEIDVIGRQRGTSASSGGEEREQTLNQILVEMDGFEPNAGVIIMAATNRPDVLDAALLRPGRFDRRVMLDPPDVNDREEILKIHAKNKPLDDDANLRQIAERTPGFSGADLANVLNEAAILTARENKTKVGMKELRDSIEKVILGPERKSHILSVEEKRITAYHEAGHALVAHMLKDADSVHKVSIISRGSALGYTMKLPDEDRKLHKKSQLIADLAVSLGGQVAEIEIFGADNLTTGASSDLRHASQMAKKIVTDYGMSDVLGSRVYSDQSDNNYFGLNQRDYSEKIAEQIDQEINLLLKQAKERAREIITRERVKMDKVVAVLIEKETIEKEEFEALMA